MRGTQEQQISTTSSGLFDDYLNRREFAAEIGVRIETLIRWEKDGQGPPVTRFGRTPYYYKPSIVEWQRSQEKKVQRA